MSRHCSFNHVTLRKCHKYYICVIILISVLVLFQSSEYVLIAKSKPAILEIIGIEIDSSLSVPIIYEDRFKTLSGECNHSQTSLSDIKKCAPDRLIRNYPWLKAALFPLQSKSLMYCAVPKIASKTLISLLIYVYVRDIIDYLQTNWTDINANRTRLEQLVNIPKLIEGLGKNGIKISNINEPNSVVSLLETYLHILRFESINDTSHSLYLNPWRLGLDNIFPNIHFKSISNVSEIFTPSFTRVLFVRHPFERLASAYKERIATLTKDRIQPEPHYDTIRRIICRRYTRTDLIHLSSPSGIPCEDVIPPFEHFVQYILLNTETPSGIDRMDSHWKPYAVVCQICQFEYNFIGKYETFNDDFGSLLKRVNVSDWNMQKRRGASGHTKWQYQQLYSSLSDELICRLKRLYKDDFVLFNYRLEDYVNRPTLKC